MNESKFTPGPWVKNGTRIESMNEHGWANDGWIIAGCEGPQAPDNASLIAAAPRLYKALEGFVAAMRDGVTHKEIMANIAAADKEARLALAEVRGEE